MAKSQRKGSKETRKPKKAGPPEGKRIESVAQRQTQQPHEELGIVPMSPSDQLPVSIDRCHIMDLWTPADTDMPDHKH